jgi:2-polyprenyl-6-methoxyphenol hydroxylase-like FAD-dependent oxidoreductase
MNNATEIWDPTGRLGIVPLPDDEIYWYACLNAKPNDPNLSNYSRKHLSEHFRNFHFLAADLIKSTTEHEILHNDIYDLPPLPTYSSGNVLLLGDAAHAATPNMGQGACQAIEDAAVLANLLKECQPMETIFRKFSDRRLARTQYIISQSRKIGRMAQISNPLLASIRNALLPMVPESFSIKQMRQLYEVSF